MNRYTPLTLLVALLLVAGGCASTGGPSVGTDPDRLGATELVEYPHLTAYQMIRQHRPLWLNERGGGTDVFDSTSGRSGTSDVQNSRGVRIYINGVLAQNGIQELELITVREVAQMERLDAQDASMRFGIGNSSGAILVTLKN